MRRIYLIDIDGTLLLSGGAGFRALNRVFVELYDVPDAMATVRPAGKTDPLIVEEGFVASLGRAPTSREMDTILDRYVAYLPRAMRESPGYRLLAGVPSALVRLGSEGHLLGIASGNLREGARIKLARGNLESYFTFGGYADDASDRAGLVAVAARRGIAQLGEEIDPREIIVVGDTPLDVAAARANGLGCVGVASGTCERQALEASGPDRIIETLDAL